MTKKFSLARIFPDPRVAILCLLASYLVLGTTVLGFNRSPYQILLTSLTACFLEVALGRIFSKPVGFPLSALITSCGLSILLNYSHTYVLLFIPVFFAIGSKYVFTFKSKHAYNPALFGVVLSLLTMNELITSAPAYQWYGITSMAFFILVPALMFLMPNINRTPLVTSFLITFFLETLLRSYIMRYHLPFETIFWGALSSPAFLLFTFFMITDPKTSPDNKKEQILVGVSIAVIDLIFHLKKSYYTFFFAAFTVGTIRLAYQHLKECRTEESFLVYFRKAFWDSKYYLRPLLLSGVAGCFAILYNFSLFPITNAGGLNWTFEEVSPLHSGINPKTTKVYERLDARVQNVAKWILSVGDSVAVGDYNGDGLQDLFFTFPLKEDGERLALYKNLGNYQFERVRIPALEERAKNIEKYGLPTNAMFVDYNNDGALDLLITYAFGSPVLLKNTLKENGKAEFVDVTHEVGLDHYTNSVTATFLDINRSGKLDLIIGNVLPTHFPDYPTPTLLNLFKLPQPEYPGDVRMFHFMHESWNRAQNGGLNEIFLQTEAGKFVKQDSRAWGLPETGWTLAIGTGDLNQDGWPDIYIANDFGHDDLYFNEGGKHFKNIKGSHFGSVGRDTYKGMNVSIGDLRNRGWLDVYVANVHHDLQAEGSLLWEFSKMKSGELKIVDRATQMGVLNERRFGWGAAMADFDNDGWLDIAQANGMVDDTVDRKFEKCPDYWYVNEKIARTPPWIHSYSNRWGDIRGKCVHGTELNRLYMNRGNKSKPQFIDVAHMVGMTQAGNSRGMAAVDLTNSGRLDLVVTHMFQPPTIYKNRFKSEDGEATPPNWIGFELKADGKKCNAEGIGTTVKLSYSLPSGETVTQMREKQVVNGFSAQGDRRIHFGLGTFTGVPTVEVNWCGQWLKKYSEPKLNQYQDLVMGE